MAQILDSVPPDRSDRMLCCYVNATGKIQIARITNVPNWYFERVVFPGQRLMFEAVAHAQLEIHTGMMASAILSDTIPCTSLCVEPIPPPEAKSSKVPDKDTEPCSTNVPPLLESIIEPLTAAVPTFAD